MRRKFAQQMSANDLRAVRRFRLNPPQSIRALAESLGVGVIEAELPSGQLGYLEERRELGTKSGYVIFVERTLDPLEKRWALAHELGHYFLHRDKRSGLFDTQVHLQADQSQYFLLEDEEREAEQFAEDIFFSEGALQAFIGLHGSNEDVLASKVFGVPTRKVKAAISFYSRYRGLRT